MSNVHDIHSIDVVEEQAAVWITKLDRGLSTDERQSLQVWLENDVNKEAFLMMASTWDKVDSLSQLANLFQPSLEKNKAAKLKRAPLSLAASVVFCLFCFWSYQLGLFNLASDSTAIAQQSTMAERVYQTAVGQHSTIDLVDGSVLTLNTNSLVEVNYSTSQRLITLIKGEIFIDVAHDSNRPLSVIVNGTVFQAIGTAFNVKKSFDENIELLVTDGEVMIAEIKNRDEVNQAVNTEKLTIDTNNTRSALPGEKVIISIAEQVKQETERLDSEDIEVSLGWLNRKLIFRGQTLLEAMDEVSRYTDAKFIIPQQSLQQRKIAGVFKTNDIELLLATLYENFNIHHQKTQHGKILLVAIDDVE